MFFYDPEELIGKRGLDYIHPEDKKKLLPLLKKYIKFVFKDRISKEEMLNAGETIEYCFKDKKGNCVPLLDCEMIGIPLFSPDPNHV